MVIRCYYTYPLYLGHVAYVYGLLYVYFDCLNDIRYHSDSIRIITWDNP
jgi:hypothetical protein